MTRNWWDGVICSLRPSVSPRQPSVMTDADQFMWSRQRSLERKEGKHINEKETRHLGLCRQSIVSCEVMVRRTATQPSHFPRKPKASVSGTLMEKGIEEHGCYGEPSVELCRRSMITGDEQWGSDDGLWMSEWIGFDWLTDWRTEGATATCWTSWCGVQTTVKACPLPCLREEGLISVWFTKHRLAFLETLIVLSRILEPGVLWFCIWMFSS